MCLWWFMTLFKTSQLPLMRVLFSLLCPIRRVKYPQAYMWVWMSCAQCVSSFESVDYGLLQSELTFSTVAELAFSMDSLQHYTLLPQPFLPLLRFEITWTIVPPLSYLKSSSGGLIYCPYFQEFTGANLGWRHQWLQMRSCFFIQFATVGKSFGDLNSVQDYCDL